MISFKQVYRKSSRQRRVAADFFAFRMYFLAVFT